MLNFIFGMIVSCLLVDCILMLACAREKTGGSDIFRFLIYLPFAPLMIIDIIRGNWKTTEEKEK